MGFFGMLFLIAVVWLVIRGWRRSELCLAGDPTERNQPDYIEALESRLSELEERLDFTERLLASRKEQG